MHDLFNPAGLRMLEDRQGAIAYGYVAPRVFYARFVGQLSAELGVGYVRQLEAALGEVPALACFADASALRDCAATALTSLARLVATRRVKLASLVILTRADGPPPEAVAFADALGEPVEILCDPLEFEYALANVAPPSQRLVTDLSPAWQVWQVPAPG